MKILIFALIALLFIAPIQASGFLNSIAGFAKGVFTSVVKAVELGGDAIAHPIATTEAVGNAISHPVAAVKGMARFFKDCDSKNKAECAGRTVGNVGVFAATAATGQFELLGPYSAAASVAIGTTRGVGIISRPDGDQNPSNPDKPVSPSTPLVPLRSANSKGPLSLTRSLGTQSPSSPAVISTSQDSQGRLGLMNSADPPSSSNSTNAAPRQNLHSPNPPSLRDSPVQLTNLSTNISSPPINVASVNNSSILNSNNVTSPSSAQMVEPNVPVDNSTNSHSLRNLFLKQVLVHPVNITANATTNSTTTNSTTPQQQLQKRTT